MDAKPIVLGGQPAGNSSRAYWEEKAAEWVAMRTGLAGATKEEFCAGYVGDFKPVYAKLVRVDGEPWYVWFVTPGQGVAGRIVNQLLPGVFCDHEGNVIEHDPAWTMVLGTVTRLGDQPLLSLEMLRGF